MYQALRRSAQQWCRRDSAERHRLSFRVAARNVFGIQLEVLPIDDSKPAVDFRALVLRNQWQKTEGERRVYATKVATSVIYRIRTKFTHQSVTYYAIAFGPNTARRPVTAKS
jgi:hypothetical protein